MQTKASPPPGPTARVTPRMSEANEPQERSGDRRGRRERLCRGAPPGQALRTCLTIMATLQEANALTNRRGTLDGVVMTPQRVRMLRGEINSRLGERQTDGPTAILTMRRITIP